MSLRALVSSLNNVLRTHARKSLEEDIAFEANFFSSFPVSGHHTYAPPSPPPNPLFIVHIMRDHKNKHQSKRYTAA